MHASTSFGSGKGPNYDCPNSAILPLTPDKPDVVARIDAMHAEGGTNIHQGVIWGFHMLSPSEPLTEGNAYNSATSKVMIVMTDGENTHASSGNMNGSSWYVAYGYPYNERLGEPGDSTSELQEEMDARTEATCTNAKTAGITIFTICTNTPAGIGIVVGGRLADVRGRRVVGAIGTFGGAVLLASAYHVSGPWLWLAWVSGSIVAAMTVPALAVYGPELFPTALRGRANALITLTGVVGGAIGLSLAGRLADHYGRLGPGLTMLAAGPIVVAVLVLTLYPETAHMELEELNPEDAAFTTAVV